MVNISPLIPRDILCGESKNHEFYRYLRYSFRSKKLNMKEFYGFCLQFNAVRIFSLYLYLNSIYWIVHAIAKWLDKPPCVISNHLIYDRNISIYLTCSIKNDTIPRTISVQTLFSFVSLILCFSGHFFLIKL